MRIHKHGGMWFWKVGRIGGSLYVSKHKPRHFDYAYEIALGMSVGVNIIVWSLVLTA